MTIHRSPILAPNATPSEADLWEMPYVLFADGTDPIVLRNSFTTDVTPAKTVAEERISRSSKPRRTLEYTVTAVYDGEAAKLLYFLMRRGQARTLQPLYCDATHLTVAASGTTLTLASSPLLHRFFVGGRVLVAVPERAMLMPQTAIRYITAIDAGAKTLTLDSDLDETMPIGARVYPLIESRVELVSKITPFTDDKVRARILATETVGRTALTALQAANTVPDGVQTHTDGRPIFDFLPAWPELEIGTQREGEYSALGRGDVLQVFGSRSRETIDFAVQTIRRTEAGRLIRFWESRAGRCWPFWIADPITMFTATAVTSTTLTINTPGESFDLNFSPDVAIVQRDGTIIIRRVTSFTSLDGSDVLTLASTIGSVALSDIRRVTSARLVRFNRDDMVETWVHDQAMRTDLELLELLREQSVTLGMGQADGTPGDTPWAVPAPCCDPPTDEPIPTEIEAIRYTRCSDSSQHIYFDQDHDPLAPVIAVDSVCYFRDGIDAAATATNPTVDQAFEDCVTCLGEDDADVPVFSPTVRYQTCSSDPVASIYLDMLNDPVSGVIRVSAGGDIPADCYFRMELSTTPATVPTPVFTPAGESCEECLSTLRYISCDEGAGEPVYFSQTIDLSNVVKIGGICYVANGTSTEPATNPAVTGNFETCAECNNAVHYTLCAGQESGTTDLYYAVEDDPEAAVIQVGGVCYERVGLTESESTNGTTPTATYENCGECGEIPCSLPGGLTGNYTLQGEPAIQTVRTADSDPTPKTVAAASGTAVDIGNSFAYSSAGYWTLNGAAGSYSSNKLNEMGVVAGDLYYIDNSGHTDALGELLGVCALWVIRFQIYNTADNSYYFTRFAYKITGVTPAGTYTLLAGAASSEDIVIA